MIASPVTKSQILKYFLLPGLLPRAGELFLSGFGLFAFFMAQVYRGVRLLPETHPYLNTQNIGQFGLRDVIAAAANNIVFKKENIDQIVIFVALLVAQIILAVQAIAIVFAIFAPSAMALGGLTGGGYFSTPNPSQDIAFIILDRVFGVPGVFGSCISTSIQCFGMSPDMAFDTANPVYKPYNTVPWPFHSALHSMFQFYSVALLSVATFIFLYFVIVTVAETAQTGTPFGKRFNSVWVPIRLVVALGLLIPIGHGLNSAQYITLYAAKWGSSFATNGWLVFNNTLSDSLPTTGSEMVASPSVPEVGDFLQFMMLAKTCKYIEEEFFKDVKGENTKTIEPYLVKYTDTGTDDNLPLIGTNYDAALQFFQQVGKKDITIAFGHQSDNLPKDYRGHVNDYCGTMVIETTDLSDSGASLIREAYYRVIQDMWANNPDLDNFARAEVCHKLTQKNDPTNCLPTATLSDLKVMTEDLIARVGDALDQAVAEEGQNFVSGKYAVPEDHLQRGWAGAAIWYNTIARANGALISAAWNFPRPSKYPRTMEDTRRENAQNSQGTSSDEQFTPSFANGTPANIGRDQEDQAAMVYSSIFKKWRGQAPPQSSNVFEGAISAVFGAQGLFELRDDKNRNVHPLAQLVGVGKGLIDATIRNLGFAGIGGLMNIFGKSEHAGVFDMLTGFVLKIATLTLTMGFILYYIIPFLPFLYFFFATGTWVKGIFEAMVGVPLWALAHIRIDGNGLPGDAAMNGYYMLFEIFLRPILILFGLMASISIFAAMAGVLHDIFDLAVYNVTGTDLNSTENMKDKGFVEAVRGPIDQLFFTVMYAIIMYIMALSSFKLIDLIPNQIMRWLGTSVSTFSDFSGDAAQSLTQYAAIGGTQVFGNVTGGLRQAQQGLRQFKEAQDAKNGAE